MPSILLLLLFLLTTVSAQLPAITVNTPATTLGKKGRRGGHNRVNTRRYFGWIPKPPTAAPGIQAELDAEFLHAHNWVRRLYKLPPFVWDEKLAGYARGYLKQRFDDCKLTHSNSVYGENMFWGKRLHWTPSDATYYWYMEKEWYDFKTLTCLPPPKACGHFTQMVWRDSTRVGCGLQHCRNKTAGLLMACEYDPPGNFENENPLEQHTK